MSSSSTSCFLHACLLVLLVAEHVTSPTANSNDCSSNLAVQLIEKYFDESSMQGVAAKLLGEVQTDCKSSKCPRVDLAASCKNQTIDDVRCEIKDIFSKKMKLGTDDICNVACSDWPCKAGCNVIDTGICYTSDWLLCKAGCAFIPSCVRACEHKIVDPCKEKLIKECSDKCEDAFHKCKSGCEEKLTLDINGDFEGLHRVLSSMNLSSLTANCSGNGIMSALSFQARAVAHISNAALAMNVRTRDAGVSSTTAVNLRSIRLSMVLPLSGSLQCGLVTENITVHVARPSIFDVDLDVDLQLDKTLDTIASVVCADLPFCKDAIKRSIAKTIKKEIIRTVPLQVAKSLQPALQKLVDKLHCPKIQKVSDATGVVSLVV